jgi:hypothetical protein
VIQLFERSMLLCTSSRHSPEEPSVYLRSITLMIRADAVAVVSRGMAHRTLLGRASPPRSLRSLSDAADSVDDPLTDAVHLLALKFEAHLPQRIGRDTVCPLCAVDWPCQPVQESWNGMLALRRVRGQRTVS